MQKPTPDAHPFLTGGGEVADIIATFDWTATALGTLEDWPLSQKSAVGLILQSHVPIVTLWGDDGIMIYNDAYSGFAGDRHPKLFGSKVREGWPEIADFNDNIMKTGLAGKTLAYREFPLTLYRRDGKPEQVWLDLDYSPLLSDEGVPIGVMAIVVEITSKIQAQRALEAERESLKRMFEQAPGFLSVLSGPEHRFVMANQAYKTLVGHRDVTGKTVKEALPEIVEQGFLDLLDRAYETGEPYVGRGVPVKLQQQLGSEPAERFLDFIYQPIVSEDGETTGIFVQGNDVTEQFETDRAIRSESHKLAVLNRTGAAVAAELDVDRIVEIVTDAATDLVGAEFGAFFYNVVNEKGESYMLYALSGVSRDKFDKFPMPRNTEVFAPTFSGSAIVRSDDILNDPRYGKSAPHYGMPEGHLPVRSYLAVPVVSRTGEVIGGLFFGHGEPAKFVAEHEELLVGIAGQAATAIDNARLIQAAEREVAERRRAEAALQTLNATLEQRVREEVEARSKIEEQLRQVHKMEAVGQLTGGIAHDFNNMLAIVISGLNLLQRRLARGDTDVGRFVEAAIEGANRAATLTQRLLAFSRQQPLSPEPLAINKLVAGMSELLSRTLGANIEVETVLAAGLWQIKADPAQLENAILNLAVNARDAMPDGGKLTIEAQNVFVDEAYGAEYAIAPGQFVMIAVADTGCGMSVDLIAKAFDPFFTTKEVGKGTGLGLSQVYGFVRQSGGHVKIYSEADIGTTVKIYLPRHSAEVEQAQAVPPLPVYRGAKNESILVVEDDDRVRALSVEALRELGYTVSAASGPREALRIFERGEKFSLLFTDIVMPEMSGRELADLARGLQTNIKVLYTTGYTRNAIVHNGILDAGTGLLTKPFSLEDLAFKVRKMLDE
ncbi:GAF domain-containing protein [Hyphomicrobium sp.]|uniref:GAF domain-containing protein n=1 Tax=Hyphomicrobium sp. TaxID=82 RepID=UPI002C6216FE|nr:GAF domain-containing protein [Hyphomicrobium sp.]HRN87818.1 GAF domain-containing protein [Hyphomicrobium sp.]HRQ26933.1 GAF domain-containing protein [Hyphomicrobium sp.]